jgi:hypothetical protein
MILFFLYIFVLSLFPNLYYFLFKLLFSFSFSKFYIEFKEINHGEREFTLIIVLSTRYDDFLIYIVH